MKKITILMGLLLMPFLIAFAVERPSSGDDNFFVTIFGHDGSTVAQTEDTLWPQGGDYTFPTTAGTWIISSDSATDDIDADTGAQKVTITGLDGSYAPQTETVAIKGVANIATTSTWLRVNSMRVADGVTNVGTIYLHNDAGITGGTPGGPIQCTIEATKGRSACGFYTVAAGKQLYISDGNISTIGSSMTIRIAGTNTRFNEVIYSFSSGVAGEGGVFSTQNPIVVEEKKDVELRFWTSGVKDAYGSISGYVTGE